MEINQGMAFSLLFVWIFVGAVLLMVFCKPMTIERPMSDVDKIYNKF